MIAIISVLVILSLSYLIIHIATAALSMTGLSYHLARLQAISAFTGVGFTTEESEHLVQHPVRRRILITLMILGNAGVITAVSSLIISFTGIKDQRGLIRFFWLGAGVIILLLIVRSRWINQHLAQFIERILRRWSKMEVRDYANLLQLTEDYTVMQWEVDPDDWLADRKLKELKLPEEGITVLGIHRKGHNYVGVPHGDICIEGGDILILYGREDNLAELSDRKIGPLGDVAHQQAVASQKEEMEKQDREEKEHQQKKEAEE